MPKVMLRCLHAPCALVVAGLLVLACTPGESDGPASATRIVALTMICGCVANGTNGHQFRWLRDTVIPKFETEMRRRGRNVTVELDQNGAGGPDHLALDLRSGRGDVVAFDGPEIAGLASAGLLRPLDRVQPVADSWDGWSKIPASMQNLVSYNDQRYGIPMGTDARAIWFRKDVFRRAGLPESWQPRSWSDLLAAAQRIKDREPGVTPLQIDAGTAMGEATSMQGLYPLIAAAGSWIYDFEARKYVVGKGALEDALNLYKTVYVDKRYGDPRLQELPGARGRNQSFAEFRDGKIAMLVESDWLWRSVLAPGGTFPLSNRDLLVSWAMIPAERPGMGYRGQDFVTVSGGGGGGLGPRTSHPSEAWQLLSFMFSKEMMQAFERIEPRIPSRIDVGVQNDPVLFALTKLLSFTVVRPNVATYQEASAAAQQATEEVVTGRLDAGQAAAAYVRTMTGLVGSRGIEDQPSH